MGSERFEAIAREMFNQVITQPDTFIRPLLNQLDNDKYTDLLTTHWTPLSLFSSVDTIRNTCDMTIVGWTDELLEVVQQLKSTLVNIYKVYRPAIHPVDATTTTTSITDSDIYDTNIGLEQLVKCITNQLDMNDKSLQHIKYYIIYNHSTSIR
ncbi:hypothetical protein BDF22DRAFT_654927 [Syncephalis plumigaleata]|nr:hypothetical protein BDF22DRAFT_654927 [Syncephalis plumigaleata]